LEGIATPLSAPVTALSFSVIEVVDLVWKGLRQSTAEHRPPEPPWIEVVDLVWKGLRHVDDVVGRFVGGLLKSLTWFGRDCDNIRSVRAWDRAPSLKSLTWFGRDCDKVGLEHDAFPQPY